MNSSQTSLFPILINSQQSHPILLLCPCSSTAHTNFCQVPPITSVNMNTQTSELRAMLMAKEQQFSKRIASSYLLNSSQTLQNYCIKDVPTSSATYTIFGSRFTSLPDLSTPNSPEKADHEHPREVLRSCSSADSENNDNRPYKCELCSKRFRFKSNLFEHKSIHSQQSHAFVCPFCGKTCRLKGNLKKHLQVHVNTVEELEKLWQERFSRSSGRPRKSEKLEKSQVLQGLDLHLSPQLAIKTMNNDTKPTLQDILMPITSVHTGLNNSVHWPI